MISQNLVFRLHTFNRCYIISTSKIFIYKQPPPPPHPPQKKKNKNKKEQKKKKKKKKLYSSFIQNAMPKLLEQSVQNPAVKTVLDQTTPATAVMDPVCSVVLMDFTEKNARIVSEIEILNVDTS